MIIYADVLITLNLLINYFLIIATQKLLRKRVKWYRSLSGAFLGALASLYIFIPQTTIVTETAFKIGLSAIISITVFGFVTLKQYLKAVFVFFLVTCCYAGVMIAVWYIFKPYGMAINNSIVYFNFSPLIMVVISVVTYILFLIGNKIFARDSADAQECEISVFIGNRSANYNAIVDTGNSLCDVFGNSEILIVDNEIISKLFDDYNEEKNSRYRVIPFKTVSGEDLLEGYRCDSSVVVCKDKTVTLKKPIIASSKIPLKEGYSGIVNPKIFN